MKTVMPESATMNFLDFVLSALAASVLLGLSIPMIESPYWLASNGNIAAAYHCLRCFRDTELLAARDIYQIHDFINNRQIPLDSHPSGITPDPEPRLITTNRRMITSLSICVVLMHIRGMSRVLVSETGFLQGKTSLMYSLVQAIFMAVRTMFFVVMTQLLDQLRRRRTILVLLYGLFTCVMLLCAVPEFDAFYLCFTALHFFAEAPIALYVSEVFPLDYRGMAPQTVRRCNNLTLRQRWVFPWHFLSMLDPP